MPNVSLSWLRDHVEIPADVTLTEVADALVGVGFEEEEIHPPKVTGPLVVGEVLTKETETHSNGKTVNYCRVNVGTHNDAPGSGKEKSTLPSRGVICGAHNFEVGDKVVVALPGAVLPGPFPISQRKTYGHISDGMICSERELGLGEDHDGIIVLERLLPGVDVGEPGTDLVERLGLGEEVLEVNVTPDRGYGFAVRGLAREYSHASGAPFVDKGLAENLKTALPPHSDEGFEALVAPGSDLEGRPACDRFVTQVVRGLDPAAPTPAWMVERLEQAGMRPISLPVDVTNYVMLDLGQPLHAYALESVAEPIVVRRATSGEPFTTLDGAERSLHADDIVITDSPGGAAGSRLIGLGGVMGGLDSEVNPDTTDVVIEGAHFDPVSIARTSRRHRLVSESSKRFERGVDPLLAPVAVHRTAELLAEYGGGTLDPIRFDYNAAVLPEPVTMNVTEPLRITGRDYSAERIQELLELIGASVEVGGGELIVTPPSWRPDLTGPAHLVEEVARLDGYDNIPTRLPATSGAASLTPAQWARRRVSDVLAETGAVEVLSYPFIGNAHDRQGFPADDQRRDTVKLRNPLADDAPALRTSLLDSLLDVAERNAARGNLTLAVFELGMVTEPQGTEPAPIPGVDRRPGVEELTALHAGVPRQPDHLAGVFGGPLGPSGVLSATRRWDWADAISVVRRLAEAVGVDLQVTRAWMPPGYKPVPGPPAPKPENDPNQVAPWHPGRVARLYVRRGKELIDLGMAGELHPAVTDEYGLPARSSAFEIDLHKLVELMPTDPVQATKVSVYPPAKIDLALVLPETVPAADVERILTQSVGPVLETLQLFDVYTGEQVEPGARSLAFSLTLRAPDHTLSTEEVTKIREKAIFDVEKRLGAKIRA